MVYDIVVSTFYLVAVCFVMSGCISGDGLNTEIGLGLLLGILEILILGIDGGMNIQLKQFCLM